MDIGNTLEARTSLEILRKTYSLTLQTLFYKSMSDHLFFCNTCQWQANLHYGISEQRTTFKLLLW
jgi:hypothetical protein